MPKTNISDQNSKLSHANRHSHSRPHHNTGASVAREACRVRSCRPTPLTLPFKFDPSNSLSSLSKPFSLNSFTLLQSYTLIYNYMLAHYSRVRNRARRTRPLIFVAITYLYSSTLNFHVSPSFSLFPQLNLHRSNLLLLLPLPGIFVSSLNYFGNNCSCIM